MRIRQETPADIEAIHDVTTAAFGREVEAKLVELIRQTEHFVPELSLVAVSEDRIIGHILLSRVFLRGAAPGGAGDRMVLSLAPLTVHPDRQNQGVGGKLIAAAVSAARDLGEDIIVLEGHPSYYPKFGFESAVAAGIAKPDPRVPDDAFMVMFLDEAARGTTGKLDYPQAFHDLDAIGP